MLIRDIKKAMKDFDFSDYFVDREGHPAWEKWEKVLTPEGVKGITEILKARALKERWYLREFCESADDIRRGLDSTYADMKWTEIPNAFGHWTESHDFLDEPNTRLHLWMDTKGWLRDEFSGEPANAEDKELMFELGLVKYNWQRLTDNGIVNKSFDDDEWLD